jgi:hypothetical protein
MKTRNGFVSNSSSTSFVITNLTDKRKTLVEFVIENPQLLREYEDMYGPTEHCQAELLFSAKENDVVFEPRSSEICAFGDEDGTLIGRIFDYILRDGGKSESFKWEYYQSLR